MPLMLLCVSQACNSRCKQRLQGQRRGGVFRLLGFFTLGWRDLERQHDVVEFADFVHWQFLPRSLLAGVWQGHRQALDDHIHRTVGTPLSKCIGLIAPHKHNPSVQSLINQWFAQEHRQVPLQARSHQQNQTVVRYPH